ncbi:MAG: 30S ribosomal protein S8 [uncultured bacterium]|uniref:Small ribosomal subunit protein uS8 n=4 Tax=Candidatus Daviesiibacteriota TaxID=1752718 RepID=A0A0G0EY33_9BACT|nr:MAG: 30S ribosomal protein S8 [uncultured bacterium]KKQ10412.1 MAG: 30S ribosomal protein S8 [Candidatus Daviesbacteria bacterium GW2011_GWB1_36_5]KKQ15792.1 MAG: 30S ribosomal protein S8 [Candidatus Daviesbacteria bacterium GW2011_GWA1_36_8]OGE16572.1 MAG: 30S ribosomal protein S8 [Candidatus Daviesbacteria bacterium RIFCSPHIGHO2_01_FULL_36_37]OGE31747.1 MAG: 30S ribosomal protein S8 [Candidatus Daviesbacteria bacterium RIFCSPHIGHO2_02_FULL_37_9]OGE34655.1 MAG: 30S ribosomal protein S8 [Ca
MDTVADALIRIKNSYMAYKSSALLPYSKLVKSICEVLKNEGFIESFEEASLKEGSKVKVLRVALKYQDRKPVINGIKRISKPGLRVYKGKTNLPFVLNGLGIAIISTPRGVMTDKSARKDGVGGEVLAYVW